MVRKNMHVHGKIPFRYSQEQFGVHVAVSVSRFEDFGERCAEAGQDGGEFECSHP
jgi:hypothetical protein